MVNEETIKLIKDFESLHDGDLKQIGLQPTAVNPMSGFEGLTGHQSCIIGHPKVQLKSLPVLEGYHIKVMMTTGACTVANYSDTKAGKKGEFHHVLGFAFVEIRDNDIFYMRQITATDDGSFINLNHKVVNL